MELKDLNLLEIVILAMESEIVKFGYTEDEICAMDIEEDCLRFFMSDGEIVTMNVNDMNLMIQEAPEEIN